MNEKIKELAEQSGATLQFNRAESPNNQWSLLGNDKLEQFAELIIRECTNILHNPDTEPYSAEWTWRKHFIKQIKQHFGVDK